MVNIMYDLNNPEYAAAVSELKAFREHKIANSYSLLKIMVGEADQSVDNLKIYGYHSLEDALRGTIKMTERDIKKKTNEFLKKYPD